jgi:hypothetical protein
MEVLDLISPIYFTQLLVFMNNNIKKIIYIKKILNVVFYLGNIMVLHCSGSSH